MSKEDNIYPHPIILFDGLCNLCNSTINFIIKHDKKKRFHFSPLESEFGNHFLKQFDLPPNELNTVILLIEGSVRLRSDAALEIVRVLGFPWSILRIIRIVPIKLRDCIYSFISKNRYSWFGKRQNCVIPDDEFQSRFMKHRPANTADSMEKILNLPYLSHQISKN